MLTLPDNLKFQYCYQDKPLDLSTWAFLEVQPTTTGISVCTQDGKLLTGKSKKVWDLIGKYSCVFTYNPPGQNDLLISLLSEDQLMCLNLFGVCSDEGHEIKKMKSFMRVDGIPIVNLFAMTKTDLGSGLDTGIKVAQEIIGSRPLGLYNLSSGASEARALITQDTNFVREVGLVKKQGRDTIDKANAACHGGRMESSGLGSEWETHHDLIKAHLGFLEKYPGIEGTVVSKGGTRGFDRALGTSIYYIIAEVPTGLKFNPLPENTEAGIKYRTGEIKGWYFKRYLLLLESLRTKFRVLDSIQYFGPGSYPLREWSGYVRGLIRLFEIEHPNLECKHLYSTIAGSCKSIYMTRGKDLEIVNKASRVLDPFIYGYVLSEQNCLLYEKALETDASSIKIDSIGTRRRHDLGKRFKIKGEGMSTYLTPSLKTIPGGNPLYRNEIINQMGQNAVTVRVKSWTGLSEYLGDSIGNLGPKGKLGQAVIRNIVIKPHFGTRHGQAPARVGELLTRWIESKAGEEAAGQGDLGLQRLDSYVERTKDR